MKLILASTSIYRKKLLSRLGLPFEIHKPDCDEDHYKDLIKDPLTLARTLSELKARSLKEQNAVVIGGDQLAHLNGEILGKPKSRENNIFQLQKLSGKTHTLITAVTVLSEKSEVTFIDETQITFRKLSPKEIINYVDLDRPFDCAGGYKFEEHGILLIEKINCSDATAIEGLPLIELTTQLKALGFPVLGSTAD